MAIDRRTLLLQRANSAAAASNPALPPHIRAAYKKAMDSADVALGMQDAKARAQAKLAGKPQEQEERSPGKP